MGIQIELRKWADRTAKGYVAIANEYGEDAPSFYTQSDLTKIIGSPEIMVLGINPGSNGFYSLQKTGQGWDLNGGDMDGEHLIKGNYFINNGISSWSNRNTWHFWNRLKAYFKDVTPKNPLEDEKKFVLTNMTFFNSDSAKDIKNPLFYKSMPYSIELVDILKPRHVLFLGGSKMLDKLKRANRNNHLFEMNFEMIKPRVCKGLFNGIPFLAVPHPSARLKREERQTVVDCITAFMN